MSVCVFLAGFKRQQVGNTHVQTSVMAPGVWRALQQNVLSVRAQVHTDH